VESRRLRWTGNVAGFRDKECIQNFKWGNQLENDHLENPEEMAG
jgi:hypothetical protein